jgi:hypothetical protein
MKKQKGPESRHTLRPMYLKNAILSDSAYHSLSNLSMRFKRILVRRIHGRITPNSII